ncbi:MAG: hypothetical protein ACOH18_03375 [Candidatus Saccharimonadaceae bacterium]
MSAELSALVTSVAFWATFLGISAVPYAMYPVAYIFESRLPGLGVNNVPVWKDQSRAYMPGDFGLALVVTVCLQYRASEMTPWTNSLWFKLASTLVGIATFLLARRFLYTPKEYSISAWNSPSKRYHDFVMYFLFCAVAVYVCLPVYFIVNWSEHWAVHVFGLMGLAVWIAGNIYDFTHNEIPNNRQHPDEYVPIWHRSR